MTDSVVYRATVPRKRGLYETDVCFAYLMACERGDSTKAVDQLRNQLSRFIIDRLRAGSSRPLLPSDTDLSEMDT